MSDGTASEELGLSFVESCRAVSPGDVTELILVSEDLDTLLSREEEVGVDDILSPGKDAGTAIGHKLHNCRSSFQNTSSSNRRKPTASKLERHKAASSSSNLRLEKQAAEIDTPGTVTKLIGMVTLRSRCDYALFSKE